MPYANSSGGLAYYSRKIAPLVAAAVLTGCAARAPKLEPRVESLEKRTAVVERQTGNLAGMVNELRRTPIVEGPISISMDDPSYSQDDLRRLKEAVLNQFGNEEARQYAKEHGDHLVISPFITGRGASVAILKDNGDRVADGRDLTIYDIVGGERYGSHTLVWFEIPRAIRERDLPMIEPVSKR